MRWVLFEVKSFAPSEVIVAKIGVERIDSNVGKTVCAQTGDKEPTAAVHHEWFFAFAQTQERDKRDIGHGVLFVGFRA
jgi:hypothetical protein